MPDVRIPHNPSEDEAEVAPGARNPTGVLPQAVKPPPAKPETVSLPGPKPATVSLPGPTSETASLPGPPSTKAGEHTAWAMEHEALAKSHAALAMEYTDLARMYGELLQQGGSAMPPPAALASPVPKPLAPKPPPRVVPAAAKPAVEPVPTAAPTSAGKPMPATARPSTPAGITGTTYTLDGEPSAALAAEAANAPSAGIPRLVTAQVAEETGSAEPDASAAGPGSGPRGGENGTPGPAPSTEELDAMHRITSADGPGSPGGLAFPGRARHLDHEGLGGDESPAS